MVIANDAQREMRLAQLTRDENLRQERYRQMLENRTASPATLADLVRTDAAVVFVATRQSDEPQPKPTPAFDKLLRGPDPKTVQARVRAFLAACEAEEELRRKALAAGIDLDGWKEALEYEA